MKNENKVFDKALDALIDEAAANVYKNEAVNIPVEVVEFSPEHTKNMEKLFKKERRKYAFRRASRIAPLAACLLICVLIALSFTPIAEAWKIKFLNFFFDSSAPDTEIIFTDEKQEPAYKDEVEFGYIPDGFELTDNEMSERIVFLQFTYKDKYFQLKRDKLNANSAVNTQSGSIENVSINNYEGIYIAKEHENLLVWHDGVYTYRISGNIEKEEIIQIAESIKSK